MSPVAIDQHSPINDYDAISTLKAQVATAHAAVNEKKPVADNFMYDFKYNAPLPLLGVEAIDVDEAIFQSQVNVLVDKLSTSLKSQNAENFASLFLPNGMSDLLHLLTEFVLIWQQGYGVTK